MSYEKAAPAEAPLQIFEGKLHRRGRGRRTEFVEGPPQPPLEPIRRPARVAIMLAVAHKIQQAIDRGAVGDRAEVARRLGLSRARVTQLLDLTLLAPDLQQQFLELEAVDGVEPICEAAIRVVPACLWAEQRASYENVCVRSAATGADGHKGPSTRVAHPPTGHMCAGHPH